MNCSRSKLNSFKNSFKPDEVGAHSDFGANWARRLCGKGNLAHRAIYEKVMLGGAALASRKEAPQFPLQSAFGMAALDRRQRCRNAGTDEGVPCKFLT
jgi:hypothetical protein